MCVGGGGGGGEWASAVSSVSDFCYKESKSKQKTFFGGGGGGVLKIKVGRWEFLQRIQIEKKNFFIFSGVGGGSGLQQ